MGAHKALKARQQRRVFRRNYAAFFIDSVGYALGFSLISTGTIMPLLLTRLGASNLVVGLAPALGNLGIFVPAAFAAPWIERLPLKKWAAVGVALVERLFILSIAGIVLLWGATRPAWAIAGFLTAWTLSAVAGGISLTAYHGMLSKCIPPESRGGLFGWGGAISGLLGIGAAELAGVILTEAGFPDGFAWVFAAGALVLALTALPLLLVAEQTETVRQGTEPVSVRSYLSRASALGRSNHSYAWAIVAVGLLSVAMAATSFYTAYAVRMLGAGSRAVGRFTAASVGATAVGMPLLGRIGDKRGHRSSLAVAAGCFAASALEATAVSAIAASSALDAMYLVIFLANLGVSGLNVSQNLLLSEFAPTPREVPMYLTFSWLVLSPFRAGSPVAAGLVSDAFGFTATFVITLVVSLAALVTLIGAVKEPRRANAAGEEADAK